MAQLNVVQINSDLFSHSARRKVLVAEISDIGLARFQPLYNDACDVGFALRNPKTGNVTRWVVCGEVTDQEHDIVSWKLVPTPESLRSNPQLAGYSITLFND